ncbi:RAMP superfamily CRISPR-associated protein [Leptolyngbya sp. AN03gr2]|uniref:RAMP superfamily CRISPR-associated protein n=1 Tax=unclassified Leptolyngbya TaxID=2650499 RepID=UPI003D3229FC
MIQSAEIAFRKERHQRAIVKRIIVRGVLVLETPTCLGSGDAESLTDLALLRDSISDRALLTGASIAGALRNYLREYEFNYNAAESNTSFATALFGGMRSDDDGEQSPLIVDDSISRNVPAIELRDGVKIDAEGIAKHQAKYDLELLAAGTEFPLNFELLIEAGNEQRLLSAIALALRGLEQGEIGIGMKKRRGFGRCRVNQWQVWKFDLRNASDRMAWLMFDHANRDQAEAPIYSSIETGLEIKLDHVDQRDRCCVDAVFRLASPLLIRSEAYSSERAPDAVHLKSFRAGELKPVLSGTSLAGVLRHRAERILRTLQQSDEMLSSLFGFVDENNKNAESSRLLIHESLIEGKTADLVQSRIAIDRFTGGTLQGALFDEQPLFGTDETFIRLQIELRCPKDREIGLLLLLLKDLWTGDLTIGGARSIGRGRLQGQSATLMVRSQGNLPRTWSIQQQGQTLAIEDARTLEQFVTAFVGEVAA